MTNRDQHESHELRLTGHPELSAADRAVESALDQLAHAERHAASPALEARVMASTQALLSRGPAPVVSIPNRSFARGFRVAAAIGVMACAGAAWLAIRPAAPAESFPTASVSTLAEDIDALITATSFADAGFTAELDKLDADTLNFGQSSTGQDWLDAIEETSL